MHFTTRCPACGTMFRVVPDQLKISDGWVRCGHCADVFDATLYLETWKPEVVSADRSASSKGLSDAPGAVPRAALETAFEPRPMVAPPAALHIASTQGASTTPDALERSRERTPPAATAASTAGVAAAPIPLQTDLGAMDANDVAPTNPAPQSAVDQSLTQAGPEPGFVQQARRRAFWHAPGMRALLSVVALTLTLALGLQFVLHERDALAAWQPRWAPALKQLCEPLGCEVAAVRRIDAIVIDSSTLVRRLGNFYSFDLVLQNTAPVALAVPALELTLTDTRDAVIARRVFLPEELPGAPALLPAKNAVTISLRLSLAVGESMPMAGYRALVFYP